MSNTILTKTIQATTSVLGVLHFMAQSSADLILETECFINKNNTDGLAKEDIKYNRRITTIQRQDKVLDKVSQAQAFMAKAKANAAARIASEQ